MNKDFVIPILFFAFMSATTCMHIADRMTRDRILDGVRKDVAKCSIAMPCSIPTVKLIVYPMVGVRIINR